MGITPDLMTMAKGLTSAHVPMGAVVVRDSIYETFMKGPEHVIELFHGYTYSGHPVAAAAGVTSIDAYREEGFYERARGLEPHFEDALHACADLPGIKGHPQYWIDGCDRDGALAGSAG